VSLLILLLLLLLHIFAVVFSDIHAKRGVTSISDRSTSPLFFTLLTIREINLFATVFSVQLRSQHLHQISL
jgi:hypothetical protein